MDDEPPPDAPPAPPPGGGAAGGPAEPDPRRLLGAADESSRLVRLAAANNAAWCDAVCRAHGRTPQFTPRWWCHEGPGLQYYPNLVTLDAALTTIDVAPWVECLCANSDMGEFGIKDSFARLDLAPLGLQPLFDGQWIHRATPATLEARGALRWAAVDSEPLRARWEAAWSRGAGAPVGEAPRFPPSLLQSPGITLLAACAGDEVVAGCTLTFDDEVVGMSCNFHGDLDPHAVLHEVVAEIHRRHPSLALVGYESADDLTLALACGFEPVGPLRVWLRASPDTPP